MRRPDFEQHLGIGNMVNDRPIEAQEKGGDLRMEGIEPEGPEVDVTNSPNYPEIIHHWWEEATEASAALGHPIPVDLHWPDGTITTIQPPQSGVVFQVGAIEEPDAQTPTPNSRPMVKGKKELTPTQLQAIRGKEARRRENLALFPGPAYLRPRRKKGK